MEGKPQRCPLEKQAKERKEDKIKAGV